MFGGELNGPADFLVERLASAETPDASGLAFAEKKKYVLEAKKSGVGALLIGPDLEADGIPSIRVSNPRLAFFKLLTQSDHPYPASVGIHATAVIDPSAQVDPAASVGAYTVIERYAVVEAGATIHPFAYVGDHCRVRSGASLLPHAVLLRNVDLGERSVVFCGAIIGGDGFGFVWDGSKHVKIPQVGKVVIGPDCEVGSLSAVDRATAGVTTVGAGSKIDNLVQVAHNVHLGEHVVMAALSGIAGSSQLGDRSTVGGLSTISDHVSICADTILGGRAGVIADIDEPGVYFDFPSQPVSQARRNMIHRMNLTDLVQRIRNLEQKLAQLEEKES
jgi:UDP-3-O-[3-hydroxymyristoyl] glucosamine N-acyltransferase